MRDSRGKWLKVGDFIKLVQAPNLKGQVLKISGIDIWIIYMGSANFRKWYPEAANTCHLKHQQELIKVGPEEMI